ncbi:hypothetical protein J6590_107591, partial [Homalodisca vitripennis]
MAEQDLEDSEGRYLYSTVEEVSSKTADNAESAPACTGKQSSSGLRLVDINLHVKTPSRERTPRDDAILSSSSRHQPRRRKRSNQPTSWVKLTTTNIICPQPLATMAVTMAVIF